MSIDKKQGLTKLIGRLRAAANGLKREAFALYLASRDPRTPWYAKACAACVAGYLASPIDLIPDFVPVIGYLDDLLIVPAGIALTIRMIPAEVMADCRQRAREVLNERGPDRKAAAVIVAIWLAMALLLAVLLFRFITRKS